jgi:hypothetical protein
MSKLSIVTSMQAALGDQRLGPAGSAAAPTFSFTSDNNTGMYRSGADTLSFATAGAERARIGSTGVVFVGQVATISPGVTNTVTGSALWPDGRLFLSGPAGSAVNVQATGSLLQFSYLGVAKGGISTDGSSVAYNTTSDYRLKDNIEALADASYRVSLLKPRRFSFNSDPDQTMVDGFIAHEVQEVVPQAVTGVKDGEDMQSIDASKLIPLLTAALQEANQRIDALSARLEALEGGANSPAPQRTGRLSASDPARRAIHSAQAEIVGGSS